MGHFFLDIQYSHENERTGLLGHFVCTGASLTQYIGKSVFLNLTLTFQLFSGSTNKIRSAPFLFKSLKTFLPLTITKAVSIYFQSIGARGICITLDWCNLLWFGSSLKN